MCAYYQDKTTKIRKEDHATYQGQTVKILSVKHIKSDKTMEIEYEENGEMKRFNTPYHASIEGLTLEKRVENA